MSSASSPAPADLSPTVLAIETSTEIASVALLHHGQLTMRESEGAQTHSMTVPALVVELLSGAGLSVRQCDALAYGMGPGSFTGVRTACGLVQGLAFGAGLRVAPVVTLMAMAESARQSGAGDDVLAVLDARMGEVYWAQYRHDGERWQCVSEPALDSAARVAAVGQAVAVGNGLSAYPDDFTALHASARWPAIRPQASAMVRLAVQAVREGQLLAPRDAQPLYLRNKVALTTAERTAGVAA